MKKPAMQFYVGDWRKDPGVQALGYFERGVWFEMLCLMHESSERGVLLLNEKPMPIEGLATILGLDNQNLTNVLTLLKAYGVAKVRDLDGALFSKRMVEDEELSKIRREVGKLGGNPHLVNQNLTKPKPKAQPKRKQKPTPSSSSSSSDNNPIVPFAQFWKLYPKRRAKDRAEAAWNKRNPDLALFETMKAALAWQSVTDTWKESKGKFVPYPATWLNQGLWTDEKPKDESDVKQEAEAAKKADTIAMAQVWKQAGLSTCCGKKMMIDSTNMPSCNQCSHEQKWAVGLTNVQLTE